MPKKISILFHNPDQAGVGYYRTLMPAIRLQKDFADDFDIEINPNVDWNDLEYLKRFDIIHAHRTLCDPAQMDTLVPTLQKEGIVVVLDLDDYWEVHEQHPVKEMVKQQNLAAKIKNNVRLVDHVTTTTAQFAEYIRPLNPNVTVIANGVDPDQSQFAPAEKQPSDKMRLMWLGGSSHEADINLLGDAFDKLRGDANLKGKYQLHLAGFDLRGTHTDLVPNQEMLKELYGLDLVTPALWKAFEATGWNLDAITVIPQRIKDRYRYNAISYETRDLKPEETVWSKYEKVFTSDYKLVENPEYVKWLKRFDLTGPYEGNMSTEPYIRHRTQGVHLFANAYRVADICLAPIKVFGKETSNRYQFAKSNLKAIEAGFHKVPLIASEVPTYTGDKEFVDGKNIVFVKPERQSKDWFKKMKQMLQNPNMVKDLGEAAYELVSKKYDLKTITEGRAAFYKSIVK